MNPDNQNTPTPQINSQNQRDEPIVESPDKTNKPMINNEAHNVQPSQAFINEMKSHPQSAINNIDHSLGVVPSSNEQTHGTITQVNASSIYPLVEDKPNPKLTTPST